MYRGGQKNQEPFLFLLNGFCEWFFPSHHTICKLFVFFKEETVCLIFFWFWSNGFASKNIKSRTSEDRTRVVGLCVLRHTIGQRKQPWRPEYAWAHDILSANDPDASLQTISKCVCRNCHDRFDFRMQVSGNHFCFQNNRWKSLLRAMIRWKM